MFIRGLDQFLHQDLFYLLQKKTTGNYTEQKIPIIKISTTMSTLSIQIHNGILNVFWE